MVVLSVSFILSFVGLSVVFMIAVVIFSEVTDASKLIITEKDCINCHVIYDGLDCENCIVSFDSKNLVNPNSNYDFIIILIPIALTGIVIGRNKIFNGIGGRT